MSFYIMKQDTLLDGARSLDGVPDNIDPMDWIAGKKMSDPSPGKKLILDLSLVSGDYRGDILGSFLTLYSDELKGALEENGVDNVDFFAVGLRDRNTGELEGGYWIANIIGRIDCIDMEKSKIKRSPSDIDESDFEIQSLAIDESKTNGAKIFRLYSDPTLVIINQELKDYFDQTDMLVGVELLKTEDYSEW